MKQFLKALDAGFTAFCNELWLPTFGFHLFDDPADALEDAPDDEELMRLWRAGELRVRGCDVCEEDVPVELAGSLGAPGDGPAGVHSPEAAPAGQPNLRPDQLSDAVFAVRWLADSGEILAPESWHELADQLEAVANALK